MDDDGQVSAVVCDNGSGMVKVGFSLALTRPADLLGSVYDLCSLPFGSRRPASLETMLLVPCFPALWASHATLLGWSAWARRYVIALRFVNFLSRRRAHWPYFSVLMCYL